MTDEEYDEDEEGTPGPNPDVEAFLTWVNLGAEFATEHACLRCYEELRSKLSGPDHSLSVWRFTSIPREEGEEALHRIVAISNEATAPKVIKVVAKWAGRPWDVPEPVLIACTNRRIETLVAGIQAGNLEHIHQEASYKDVGGLIVGDDGTMRPYNEVKESDG